MTDKKLVEKVATEIEGKIDKILAKDTLLELRVNRGHWEDILPIILTHAIPIIQADTQRGIKEGLENIRLMLVMVKNELLFGGDWDGAKATISRINGKLEALQSGKEEK